MYAMPGELSWCVVSVDTGRHKGGVFVCERYLTANSRLMDMRGVRGSLVLVSMTAMLNQGCVALQGEPHFRCFEVFRGGVGRVHNLEELSPEVSRCESCSY